MPAAFAALEDRVNNAIVSRLANAVLSIGGGGQVSGIFEREYLDASGVSSSSPVVSLCASDVPANPVGQPLVISQGRGVGSWQVEEAQPDGAGWAVLLLRSAA